MTDLAYVVAAYVVIVGGLALYAFSVLRRLAATHHPDDEAR
jgi:hypothetical protein